MHRTPTGYFRPVRPPVRACWAWLAAWVTPCVVPLLAQAQTPAAVEPQLIKAGVFTVAPYVLATPDRARGVLIDFYDNEIAPRMGVRFLWQPPVTVARLEHDLAVGAVMFTPILVHTPERDQARIQFDPEVHIKFGPCLAVQQEHKLNAIREPADLAGMTIGWVRAGALPPFMHDPGIRFDLVGGVDWESSNLGKLRLGRIDGAYFSNCASAQYQIGRSGTPLKLLPLPVPGAPLYAAFSPLAPADLVRRHHLAAQQAFAAGRFEAYLNKALEAPRP